jgi:hypothetical protein
VAIIRRGRIADEAKQKITKVRALACGINPIPGILFILLLQIKQDFQLESANFFKNLIKPQNHAALAVHPPDLTVCKSKYFLTLISFYPHINLNVL